MAQSFLAASPGALSCSTPNKRRTVLVTGAAGHIGSYFAEHCHDRYELRLMVRGDEDRSKLDAIRKFGTIVAADLSELDKLKDLFGGVDTVLHLAASASPDSTWDQVLPNNIIGSYNVMVAAKHAGCRRVIYA